MDDGMEEILRRLEVLERRVEELAQKHPSSEREEHECPFRSEERRIVDLVVRLTAERVEEALARISAERSDGWSGGHHGPYGEPPHGGPPHGGPPHGHGPPPGWHGGPPRRGR
jgi:hypothetical protein